MLFQTFSIITLGRQGPKMVIVCAFTEDYIIVTKTENIFGAQNHGYSHRRSHGGGGWIRGPSPPFFKVQI